MKPLFRSALALAALTVAGTPAMAATPEPQSNVTLETIQAPSSYELHNRRDALEAKPPISREEKERLKREAAASRPGPDK